MTQPPNARIGTLSAISAYTLWGFLPLYFIALRGVSGQEILIHRILWAVPVGALIIHFRRQWPQVRAGLGERKVLLYLMGSSAVIAVNWLIYILAVQGGNTMQASLGYYINPLIYVLVGVLFFAERLSRGQLVAVILASIGVGVLTVYGGRFPTISFALAISFTAYGVLRKRVQIGAMPGLFIETLLLAPFAAIALWWMIGATDTATESADGRMWLILAFAGPATVIPLLFFAIGARNLPLATLGFLQFIGPSIQFVVALADGEPFTRAHQICFGCIWIAAAIFAADAVMKGRKRSAVIPPK